MVDLCNKLSTEHEVTIFTIYSKGEMEKELSKNITLKSLYNYTYNEMSKIKKMLLPLKIFFTKKIIYKKNIEQEKYNVEVSFLEGPITNIFATKNTKAKKIAWIHNDISKVFGTGIKSKIKKILNKNVYNKYSNLVFVSNDNLEKFNNIYNVNNKKHVIYNYINPENVIQKSNNKIEQFINKNTINFMSVCRLVEQKALLRLINVHSKLLKNNLNHKIYIVGDGPLKEQLEEEIKKQNVQNSFILLGKQTNPYPYIKQAQIFCLFSYYEGYPMVVEEAKILNKYIAVTDTAVREVLRNYENKIIVENTENAIYNGIKQIIQNKETYLNKNKEFVYTNNVIIEQVKNILKNNAIEV